MKKSSIRKKESENIFPRLAKILADWVLDKFGWELEVVLRPDECPSKFKVIPKRYF